MLTKRVEGEGWAAVCVCVWASLFANEMMVKNIENRLILHFELLIYPSLQVWLCILLAKLVLTPRMR